MSAKIISLPFATREAQDVAIAKDEVEILQDLRRARIRIAQLEASLSEAMRDSLMNFNRARDAERRLADLQAIPGSRSAGGETS